MIRHIVLVRFAAATPPEERQAIFAELAALQSALPGMRVFAGGENISPEALSKGFTHAFCIDFDDATARDAYLVHPAHHAAGERLVRACDGGVDGLAVIDIDCRA